MSVSRGFKSSGRRTAGAVALIAVAGLLTGCAGGGFHWSLVPPAPTAPPPVLDANEDPGKELTEEYPMPTVGLLTFPNHALVPDLFIECENGSFENYSTVEVVFETSYFLSPDATTGEWVPTGVESYTCK